MKQERTQNPQQKHKPYPRNPQARPDYRDDDEYLPGQRRQLIEAQEDSEADAQISNPVVESSGNRVNQPQPDRQPDQSFRQDAQTRAEGSDKSRLQPKDLSAQHNHGTTSAKQQKPKSRSKSSSRRQQGTSSSRH